jgi:hypothetical protein
LLKRGNFIEFFLVCRYQTGMSVTEEIIEACKVLPEDKQAELVDFARFLLARQDDAAWERALGDSRKRSRLESFLRESAAEGDEPMDPSRL